MRHSPPQIWRQLSRRVTLADVRSLSFAPSLTTHVSSSRSLLRRCDGADLIFPTLAARCHIRSVYQFSASDATVDDTDEALHVEVLEPEKLSTSRTAAAWQAVCRPELPRVFMRVQHVDTFSRARVMNFLKRHSKHTSLASEDGKTDPFEVESTNSEDGERFHARVWLPLHLPPAVASVAALVENNNTDFKAESHHPPGQEALNGLWAHGVAADRKKAETLAAMHAEYIIDALGHHIYTLPSKQRKHALAAHKAGRPAPMPDTATDSDVSLPDFNTPEIDALPLPLELAAASDETDDGEWTLVDVLASARFASLSPPHTLLSPAVFDAAAQRRVESFMKSAGHSFAQNCTVRRDPHQQGAALFVAELRIPRDAISRRADCAAEDVAGNSSDDVFLTARGKALKRDDAMVLAAMHAELLLDAVAVPLFPDQPHRQKAHAQAAWSFGRPAPLPDATPKDPSRLVLPPGLKQRVPLPEEAEATARARRDVTPRSADEELVHRHRVLSEQTTSFIDTTVREETAVSQVKAYLTAKGDSRAADPFFHESILGKVKSSVVLPVATALGVCGGVGIATTVTDADVLAAMHALDVLCTFGVQTLASPLEDEHWRTSRHDLVGATCPPQPSSSLPQRPPGRRLAPGGFTRAVRVPTTPVENTPAQTPVSTAPRAVPPRRVAKRARAAPAPESQPDETVEEACVAVKEPHGSSSSSSSTSSAPLTPDTEDGFVLVCTQSSASQESRSVPESYSTMAIQSPRVLDPTSKARVMEYLSTVGRRFEDVFVTRERRTTKQDVLCDGVPLYECAGALPVPALFGDRIALGVAPKRSEAESLAAMHAELTLDALGVCLFTDANKQTAHRAACREAGRWAPSASSGQDAFPPPDTPSPPPLRLSFVGSPEWLEQAPGVAEPPSHGAPRDDASSGRANGLSAADAMTLASAPTGGVFTDVPEDSLDAVARLRVQYYLARLKAPLPVVAFTVTLARGVLQHTASWSLPIPPHTQLGQAHKPAQTAPLTIMVSGTAPTKRDADVLSWMHAERVLHSLSIPLFDNLPKYQAWRVKQMQAFASQPGRCVEPTPAAGSTCAALPPRFRLVASMSPVSLVMPVAPVLGAAALTSESWAQYTTACQSYVNQKAMAEANLFFDAERVPRCGHAVVDSTLTEVEQRPLDAHAKLALQFYCHAAKVTYPQHWHCVTAGPLDHRVLYATVPVPGFPAVTARGVGPNKEVAQRRAAMHALALLSMLDPNFAEHESMAQDAQRQALDLAAQTGDVGAALAGSQTDLFDSLHKEAEALRLVPVIKGSKLASHPRDKPDDDEEDTGDSTTFKRRVVELYTICAGLPPPKVTHLVEMAALPSASDAPTVKALPKPCYSTVVSVLREDGDGTELTKENPTWSAHSSGKGPRENERAAFRGLYDILMTQLEMVRSLHDTLTRHASLNPAQLPSLQLTRQQRDAILRVTQKAEQNDVARLAAAQEVVPAAALSTEKDTQLHDADEATLLRSFLEMTQAQQDLESAALQEQYLAKIMSPIYSNQFAGRRDALSIARHRDEILRLVEANPVVVVCGTTGCGKTTQVPQYLLDAMTERGEGGACSIVVTQPRRISAMSIAARVASERLETVGENCGYAIRFDAKPGRHINFCTTGVIMRMLASSPNLDSITYLIIDEIHERDLLSDFLLVVLRDLVTRRHDLRVILMSATLQAEQFSGYFRGAPVVNVEGYAYPVQELYLEDLAQLVESSGTATPLAREALRAHQRQKAHEGLLKDDADDDADDGHPFSTRARLSAEHHSSASQQTRPKYAVLEATTEIDYVVVQCAVEQGIRMVDNIEQSSVLVFLPGWEEIQKAKEIMERDPRYQIIPLHSSVSPNDQMRCFLPADEGRIKVVLATNIAESGITIDDVAVVVDLGRAKEKIYVQLRHLQRRKSAYSAELLHSDADDLGTDAIASKLLTVFTSRANCIQRRGRVGRTRPGVCIRLFSREHFAVLHEFQTPEMQRTPLDALCLNVLALQLPDPVTFLGGAMEPPHSDAIESAMHRLIMLGAVSKARSLTELGAHLSKLPLEPRLGKLVLLGAAFCCLDATLTVAAMAHTDVFKPGREHRTSVRLYREDLSRDTLSDDIAAINAYNFWVSVHRANTPSEAAEQLNARMLSVPHLVTASRQKAQFFSILSRAKVIHRTPLADAGLRDEPHHINRLMFTDTSYYSARSLDAPLVKAVLAASFAPCFAMHTGGKSFATKHRRVVAASPDSVLAKTPRELITAPFFVYHEAFQPVEGRRVMIQGVSCVSIWSLIVFAAPGTRLDRDPLTGIVVLDDWLVFHATKPTFSALQTLQKTVNDALAAFYRDPSDAANLSLLADLQIVISDLVGRPMSPNLLTDAVWTSAGSILPASPDIDTINNRVD